MSIQGTTVLVTGGAGFVGSHIADLLIKEKPKEIIILDNLVRGSRLNISHLLSNKNVRFIEGDIRDKELVGKLIRKTDYIFHQAAIRLLKCAQDPRLCNEVMIDGTFNVLEAAVKNKVKKMIMASSVSVYGEPSYTPMDENHPYNNTTMYGAAKIANEHMALAFNKMYNIPIVLLRYFNVYGPRMDILGAYTEVLIKWLEKLDARESPVIHGDGKQALDFVCVEDVARANILALESDIQWGIYNIGTGKSTTLKKLADILIQLTNADVSGVLQPDVKRPYVQKRRADTRKTEKDLGFKARISIEEGLKRLIEWRKKRLKEIKQVL